MQQVKIRHAFGPKAGEPIELDLSDTANGHYYTNYVPPIMGLTHADTVVQAEDRDRRQLCRYIQRPVIAQDRLQELGDIVGYTLRL